MSRFSPAVWLLVGLFVFTFSVSGQQTASAPETYGDEDAYMIYSLLLPHEESYEFAKGTIVIQKETILYTDHLVGTGCIAPSFEDRFKEALEDFRMQNSKQWVLERKFESKKPYELVSKEDIEASFEDGSWDGFYKKHPKSGGYHIFSAVGFNPDKTRAVVYSGSGCGGLCGRWRPSLFEKIDGKWRSVPGIQCMTVS